jgi:hypothetical protein
MLLDEDHIRFMEADRNLYTAHEIVQLLPVFNKERTYEKFIEENAWVKNYIPNFEIDRNTNAYKNNIFDKLIVRIFRIIQLEKIAKFLQLNYMKNHKTNEVTRDGILKFHPYDYRTYVLRDFKKKLLRYSF